MAYITSTELGRRYGYTIQAVKKWIEAGCPYDTHHRKHPETEATEWVVKNKINPLKEVSTKEKLDLAKLKKAEAEADLEELKLREAQENVLPKGYVETVLASFCGSVRQTMMQIPNIDSLELLTAAVDQKTLKRKLAEIIDKRLNEIGDLMGQPAFLDPFDEDSEDEPEIESVEETEGEK